MPLKTVYRVAHIRRQGVSASRKPGETEEFGTGARVRPENTTIYACQDLTARLPNASHHHAEMLSLDDDCDSHRLQALNHRVGNLGSQALLHLWTARQNIDDARQLAD